MSSLLDILHRKDSLTDRDPVHTDLEAEAAAQTVELRLAVDNDPLAVGTDSSLDAEPAALPSPAAPSAPDPFGTQLLSATLHQQRSRRSSIWLGTGLVLIVLAAGAATWLLNKISGDAAGSASLFATPVDAWSPTPAPAPEPGPVVSPSEPAGANRLQESAAPPPERQRSEPRNTDTDWFDTPAAEAAPGAGAEDPAELTAESSAGAIHFVRGTATNPLFPKLSGAWAAFQTADYPRAEALYREVLAADAANVDALLGLGALAARGGRNDEARDIYQAVLLAEPKNAAANSALSTLPATGTSPLDESALKILLREQPGAANLHFALGLQHVANGRWPDAQAAFFEAVRNEPTNADYAYNLAVSLDRLGQAGPAVAYYQRALDLATASTLFNSDVVRERLARLRPATS